MKKTGFLRLTPPEILDELRDELDRGKVYQCSLRSKTWTHDGLLDGESIYIDPRPQILETLIHELIHRRKPKLSERTVTKTAAYLVSSMDEATKVTWWKAWSRVKKKGVAVDVED